MPLICLYLHSTGGRWDWLEPGDRLQHPGPGHRGARDGGPGGARALRGLHPPGGQEDPAWRQGEHWDQDNVHWINDIAAADAGGDAHPHPVRHGPGLSGGPEPGDDPSEQLQVLRDRVINLKEKLLVLVNYGRSIWNYTN